MLSALTLTAPRRAAPTRPLAPRPLTDHALLERVACGDDHALSLLYDRHAQAAYALALRIVHQPLLAEDVVQETFIRAWRAAPTTAHAVREPGAWLLRIARNLALDALRRQAVRPQPVSTEEGLAVFDTVSDAAPEPDVVVAAAARRRAVHHALGALPAEQRDVIELAFFAGLTHQAIATRLDLPLGTVKTRVRLGLRKLALTLTAEV